VLQLAKPLGESVSLTGAGLAGSSGAASLGLAHATGVASGWYTTVYDGGLKASEAVPAMVAVTHQPSAFMVPMSRSGTQVEVTTIALGGSKKRPSVWVECAFVDQADRKNGKGVVTIGDVDRALRLGEVTSEKNITHDMAVAKLKEAKDLLDMGAYTQEQFDAAKAKYLPYLSEP
jgi:hypothetical protein